MRGYRGEAETVPYSLVSLDGGGKAEESSVWHQQDTSARDQFFALLGKQPESLTESRAAKPRDPFVTHDADAQPTQPKDIEPFLAHRGNATTAPVLSAGHNDLGNQANGKNLSGANANAGAGQGPRGASTPFSAGGGGSPGEGSGGPAGGNLATLANEGAFSSQAQSGNTTHASNFMPSSPPTMASPPNGGVQPLTADPPPTANNDSYTLLHDSTLSVDAVQGVLANDVDNNGLQMTAVLVSGPNNGTLQFNANGSFIYTPNAHWTGTDTFQYFAQDSLSQSNTATVTLTVNDPGLITTQTSNYSVQQGQALSVDASTGVLATANDSDGDTLTANLAAGPSNGSLQFNGDGSFNYTPNAGYVGSDSFTFTATDGVSVSSATTVNVSVTNTAPTAVNQTYGIPENTSVSVNASVGLLNGAADSDGDPLTASLVGGPSHGTIAVNGDGSFTYTPTTGYVGSDSFTYAVSDGAASANATVTLNVHADSSSPTANAANYSVQHDQSLTMTAAEGVLAYASDSDGDPLSAYLASAPTSGTVTLNPDGSFTYTPNAGFTGTDSFQYVASDGSTTSAPATATISVVDAGTPTANALSYSVERNNPYSADASTGVLATASDTDGDTLTAYLVTPPAMGQLALNPDGSFTYTPGSNFTGTDSFQYGVSDGVSNSAPATVTLTVSASAPVANNDTYQMLANTSLLAEYNGVLNNDSSPDNMPLSAIQLTQPAHGSVQLLSDGSFQYTPNSNFVGTDSFTYEANDGGLFSNAATVTINVESSNTAPSATDLNYSVAQNTSLSTDSSSGLLSGATDGDGDTLWPTLVSGPSNGTLQFTPMGDGSFTYTPNTNFYGTDHFTYAVTDGIGQSNTATVTLTVNQDVPTVTNAGYSVLPTGTTSVDATNGVLANATDPNGASLTAVVVSQPTYGSVTLNGDGSFSYTPGSNFTGSDSFAYEAYNGLAYSTPATVSLTAAPVAQAQTYSVNHDTPLTVDNSSGLLTGASDADGDTLTATLLSGPSNGMVSVNGDGSFTYTPNTHFVGTDSFTYTVSDGTQVSAPATATISLTDSVPTASDASFNTPENQVLTIIGSNGLINQVSDQDGDILSVQMVSGSAHGTLQLGTDGAILYTPDAGYFGSDTFSYDVTDGISTSSPAIVTIVIDQVLSDNYMPDAVASGDFNGDGNLDFAVANAGNNSVSVYLGDGSGNFTQQADVSVGRDPVALVSGDFTGNGLADLAVVNQADNTVSILLSNGTGGFTSNQLLAVGSTPTAIVAGDFNGDGKLDLAVTSGSANQVSIYIGNGNGTFTDGEVIAVEKSPNSLAVGDFNGDGKQDLAVVNNASNTVSILLGNGDGSFQTPVNYAVGSAPTAVAVGEFSGNDVTDIAVANSGSGTVSVLEGNGDGTFWGTNTYQAGANPTALALGDLSGTGNGNGDGDTDADDLPDLVVAMKGSNAVGDLMNLGSGLDDANSIATVVGVNSLALGSFVRGAGEEAVCTDEQGNKLYFVLAPAPVPTLKVASVVAFGGNPAQNLMVQATGDAKGLVQIRTFQRPRTTAAWASHVEYARLGKPINSLSVSPDGKTLAASIAGTETQDPSVVLLNDLGTKPTVFQTIKEKDQITALQFSPDGKTLATGTEGGLNGDVQLFDMKSGKIKATLKGHDGTVSSLAFSDNNTLASGSYDGTVRLWNVVTEKEIVTLKLNVGFINSVSYSSDGKTLAIGGGQGKVILLDTATRKIVSELKVVPKAGGLNPNENVIGVFSHTGGYILTASKDQGRVISWNAATGIEKETRTIAGAKSIYQIALSPDDTNFVVAGDGIKVPGESLDPIKLGLIPQPEPKE